MTLNLSSPAFQSGERIPSRYTCEGENVSPHLTWEGVPEAAKSLVLIFDDPDAPNGTFAHWVLYNIPPGISELQENAAQHLPQGVMQGRNTYGNVGYDGPCPPYGEEHQYYFRLFALDTQLDLTAGATRAQVYDRIQKHGIENTELILRYSRTTAGTV